MNRATRAAQDSRRRLRLALAALLRAAVAAATASPAGAVTFDFDYLPNSAGCSQAVLSPASDADWAAAYSHCDADWVGDLEGGVLTAHEQMIDGLTLTLTAQGTPLDWDGVATTASDGLPFPDAGGTISCGDTPDCRAYLADFSKPLRAIQVDLLGALNRGGPGDPRPVPSLLYLEAYGSPGAAGALLGRVEVEGTLAPETLAFAVEGGSPIRSVAFGASTLDNGECFGPCENLGVADNLVATPIPEPSAALLLLAGLVVLAAHRQRSTAWPSRVAATKG
jgi:hypothetical protein